MKYTVKDRFLKYVKIDTTADPYSNTSPSTEKQKDLTKVLMEELAEMGIKSETNSSGYVYARIPGNVNHDTKTVFFCSHIDTAYDCSGTDVKPIVHKNYQGQDIVLPDDTTQVITPDKYPALNGKTGHDIITASGLTLLGSDDKSGLAIIMDAAFQLVNNPNLKHGDIAIFFTTDEEIGRGTANVDLNKINADFGYTLDGGERGHFEAENFSADALKVTIQGVSAHPGYAKGKMENAIKIAAAIIDRLPKSNLSPETTNGIEGFVHPNRVESALEEATIDFIIRDFKTENLIKHEEMVESIVKSVLTDYPGSTYTFEVRNQYRNMRDVLDKHPYVEQYALSAMDRVGVEKHPGSIRGGTDGAMLSHMGLPCPNLFAAEQAIHSKHEWTSVQDMQAAVDTVVEICKITAEQ